MSLSRKLIENLVRKEIENNHNKYSDLNLERLTELANQVFLIQVTLNESRSVRKSVQEKIEHFNVLMSDS